MNEALSTALTFAPLAVALFSLVMTAVNKPMGWTHLASLAVLELGLLAVVGFATVQLVRGDRPEGGTATFVLYLVGSPLVLPAGAVWGLMDRSRWGSAVVAVACLVIPVLIVRMNQVWSGV